MTKLSKRERAFAATVAGVLALWGTLTLRSPQSSPDGGAAPEALEAGQSPEADRSPEAAPPAFRYIEITASCGPGYGDAPCVNMRAGPGTAHVSVEKLRTGLVLKVESETVPDDDPAMAGRAWHKIIFDAAIRYPERVTGDWYVVADPESARLFGNVGDLDAPLGATTTSDKRIVVDLSDEKLYAYDGEALFMEEPISAGLKLTPTPRGKFSIFRKTPSRYMQGPLPGVSDQYYDLPGVPWNLYFTAGGAVIHGAYWHDSFGVPWSHGCVNLSPQNARRLYEWAELGVPVFVRD